MNRTKQPAGASRRQWGVRTRSTLPVVRPAASDTAMALGQLAIVATVVGWIGFVLLTVSRTSLVGADERPLDLGTVGYIVIMTLLAASALAYLITRLGYFARTRAHSRASTGTLSAAFADDAPTLTVLVPSYQEDERVNRMTLLSAALQEYPDLSIVLLIDDPPEPRYAGPAAMLGAAQRLPREIEALLAGPAAQFRSAMRAFDAEVHGVRAVDADDLVAVADQYQDAATWLRGLAADYAAVDHADRFLVDEVFLRLAGDLGTTEAALRSAAADGAVLSSAAVRRLLQRLTWIFGARLSSFQRKRYVSLSHEPNKAMNLNSYIGLMGGAFREQRVAGGLALVPSNDRPDVVVPDPDYVLTLDSDSLLLPEYCLRMVHVLEQSEHARVAVAQAPYSAFPGVATRLERIAGATTDLQYIAHQGMTHYGATFWVGANAVLRKRALDELCDVEYRGDWEIRRYISDRTVIEDTESSIDLCIRGWSLLNHPERLSYSATPSDFGALSIQRARWANGGLLILPRLWRQVRARRSRGETTRFGELFLRVNYMASITWSSVGLLFLLLYGFDDRVLSPFIVFVSLPYFLAMASDLRSCGYRRSDVLGIYGFNLVLLAVNVAGVVSSLVQGLTSSKAAFKRTPKVRNRTAPALLFVVVPYVFVAFSALTFVSDFGQERWVNAFFAGLNTALASFAIVSYIGVRNSIVDVFVNVVSWLYAPADGERTPARIRVRSRRAVPAPTTAAPHWTQILEDFDHDGRATAPAVSAWSLDDHAPAIPLPAGRRSAARRGHTPGARPAPGDAGAHAGDRSVRMLTGGGAS
jgi:cellulose synthase/poly-beta-1,6-N-acetylglucosamine synthase-like glycosyltransferase